MATPPNSHAAISQSHPNLGRDAVAGEPNCCNDLTMVEASDRGSRDVTASDVTSEAPISNSETSDSSTVSDAIVNPQSCSTSSSTPHLSISSQTKRFIDVVGALVGIAIALPIGIAIAIAIQLDNPGPVFYRHTRCGLYGKPFQMWKFRSMVIDADQLKHQVPNQVKGFIFKNQRDPRVTRVGRLIRKTSLDELPQLWNVLRGDMSLVGTRPPTPDEVYHYTPHHWQRLQVKPGITGEWQVNGRSQVDDFEDIVTMDLAYQDKWSIGYDLQLLWKTIGVVVRSDGAY